MKKITIWLMKYNLKKKKQLKNKIITSQLKVVGFC
jgi:hypothetical protein